MLPARFRHVVRGLAATLALTATLTATLAAPVRAGAEPVSERDAYEIGVEAYTFLYPLVMMDVTRRVTTNIPAGARPGLGPVNMFHHMRAYPAPDMREVVRPNFDTLYSIAWLDLRKEPVIVSAPDTKGRYYMLPMLDMWTDVFAAPGKRTSGTASAAFAVAQPGWRGRLPKGVQRIDSPTPFVWIVGRTQTNGTKDYEAVRIVQNEYAAIPLSQWGKPRSSMPPKVEIDRTVDMKTPPLEQVNKMPAEAFFRHAAELMKANPPHATDWSVTARMKRIGLEPGKFDFAALPPAAQAALQRASGDALKLMVGKIPTLARIANGWQMNTDTMGVYGNSYLKRAIIAMVGLAANPPEDAIYPLAVADSEGKPLVAENPYVLHFDKEQLPPAEAFWSVTMYDKEGYQVANPINRFAIGDRDPIKYNPDGSLDLYLQHANPGPEKESNWLPAPASGPIGVTMRIYAPKAAALDGRWNPPPVKPLK